MPLSFGYFSQLISDRMTVWLHQNRPYADMIVTQTIQYAQMRLRMSEKVNRKTYTSGLALPGKLSDCVSQDRMNSELFLVEGESAGGSCKQARDRTFQAVLPLRGKILNTWEVDEKELLASQEVKDISIAIGVSPGSNDLTNLRYGRICLLADADSVGAHISTLLCALFIRHYPLLVQSGHVYVAMPPLYRIDVGKEVLYLRNNQERDAWVRKNGHKNFTIQRFKGLGEMNPPQLRETTMDPQKRTLLQLMWQPEQNIQQGMNRLLGKKEAKSRRVWIEQYPSTPEPL
jgi:topoisomerase-4 subunit B